ncbi:dentin sialophosphoprotein isoform X15 [Labrus bergylta]|uniref:dentin sialophosphoprotein isoform X15 n=1 Tax=Labrus bergylta TaxID=56723 RepID=UPI0033143DF0
MGCFYFLASFLFTSCLVLGAEPPTKYVLKGTGESLKPTFSGQPNSILWKHNGNKVVEFDSREEQVYGAYKNRITLDWVSAELEITGLKFEDRGLYEVEVDINNMLHLSEFKLEVIDNSSVAVAVSLAVVGLIGLIVLGLIIIFCKKRQKACFAKGQQDDEEKQTEGSDKKKAQGGETRHLLAETPLSDQRLSVSYSPEPVVDTEPRKGFVKKAIHNIEKGKKPQQPQSITETLSPPASPFGNLISPRLHADFDRGDTDADVMNLSGEEKISQPEHSNSEETKEPECVGLSDESEQPEKNQGGGEEASPVPPTDQTSPDDKLSQDEDLKDPAGGQKNGSDSEEVNEDAQDESVSQTDSSACFAKGQQDDEEKQTEGHLTTKRIFWCAELGSSDSLTEMLLSDQPLSVSYSPEPVGDPEQPEGNFNEKIEFFEKKAKEAQQTKNITGNLYRAPLKHLPGLTARTAGLSSSKATSPVLAEPEKNLGGGEKSSTVPPTDQTSPTLANSSPPKTERGPDEDPKDPAGGQKNGSDSEKVYEDTQDESDSQTDSSACFSKGQQDDEEKQTEGSDKKKAQGGETRPLLTETLLSDQRLSVSYSPEPVVDTEPRKGFVKKAIHNIEKGKKPQQPQSITETLSPPTSPFGNLISPSLHADFDRGDTDADVMNLSGEEKISQPEHSNSEETKEPECVGLSDESEQPEKNQGGGEEASPVPPTDQSSPTLANSSSPKTEGGPDEDPEDPAGGQKNGSDSDERNKDTQDESVSQTDSSACFAKGQQDDEEKQTEGSDKKKAQGGETRHLLAETLLSDQPLNVSYSPVNVKKMAGEINRRAGQEPVGDKKPRKGNLKEKEDNIEKGEKPQQTKNITEPEKNQGGGEEASPVPPTDQTSPTLANSSPPKTERGPDEDPEDPAGGQKNGSDSDEDYEDTQDESVSQTDSSGTQQNRNESDKSSVNKSSSVPHEEGSNTTSQERESATPKEEESTEEAKPVKPVPPAEETSNLMSNGEEIDEKQHLADSTEVNTSNTLTLRLQTLHMQIQSLRGRAGRTQVRGGGQAEADQGEGGNDEDKEEDQGGPEDEKSDDEW